jgi:hypothetical protein
MIIQSQEQHYLTEFQKFGKKSILRKFKIVLKAEEMDVGTL